MGVGRIAISYGKPVIGVAGTLAEGYESLYEEGFTALLSIADRPMELKESINRAPELLERAGYSLGRMLLLNFSI